MCMGVLKLFIFLTNPDGLDSKQFKLKNVAPASAGVFQGYMLSPAEAGAT
jgi:hypothetical protein